MSRSTLSAWWAKVARAEDDVRPELDVELLFQRGAHVDFGEHAEAFRRECRARAFDGLLIVEGHLGADAVASVLQDHEPPR